ncbi:MAG: hypothetical protein ACE5G8_16685, partial [Anaerolineae bacterium]
MSGGARRLARLYGGLLRLYPPRFRAEYGAELQAVFTLAAEEAAEQGRRAVVRLALRELRDLPAAIIREHRRERNRRQMIAKMSNFFNFEPGSRREALAAVGPLLLLGLVSLLPGVLGLSTAMPHWLDVVMTVAMLGLLLSAVIIGLLKRVPRWFLPYLGFVLPLLS